MKNMVDDLKAIKEAIFNNYFDNNANANSSGAFNRLLIIHNMDEDLKETLVLLHSNYIAELEMIKRYNYTALDKILTNNIEAYTAINEKDRELENLFEKMESKKPRLSIFRLFMFVVIGSVFLWFMWYLFASDKEAGKLIIELVKALASVVSPVNVNGGE